MPQPTVKFASLLLAFTSAACAVPPTPAEEQGDDDEAADEAATDEAPDDMPVDACAGAPVSDHDDCGSTEVFEWDGTRCVEVCDDLDPVEHILFDSAHDCFEAHAQCIDAEQCELGPVGTIDVSGTLMQDHPGLHAGAFRADRLYLGPDAFDVGAALTSKFGSEDGVYYPQVLGIVSATDWQVGVHEVTIYELGASWSGSGGTVTIESVTTEGNPNEWRLRGQIVADDNGHTLSGSFEVAGCVL